MKPKEWLKPLIDKYISEREGMRVVIPKTGVIPRGICENCYVVANFRYFINDLTEKEKEIAQTVIDKINKYNILSLNTSYDNSFQIESLKAIREICPDPDSFDEKEVSEYTSVNKSGKTMYTYNIHQYMKAFKSTFLIQLSQSFNGGVKFCPHIENPYLKRLDELTVVSLLEEEHEGYDVVTSTVKKKWTKTLFFTCDECYNEISRRACITAMTFNNYIYEKGNCIWEKALFLKLLKDSNKEYVYTTGYTPSVIIEPDKVLVSFLAKKIDKNFVKVVNPKTIILFGSKKQMIPLIDYGIDIFCIDDEKAYYYDSDRVIQKNINEILNRLIGDLETYTDAERGSDHDKYIKAIAKIGDSMGFVPQTEYAVKGSRVDCVWLDKNGNVYCAIEVEISGGIKKDIITTWELEPKLAIILNQTNTDKAILDLTDYMILKSIPHPLVCINTGTKTLYLFDKQNIVLKKPLNISTNDKGLIGEI